MRPSAPTRRLFVYGTLMRGEENGGLMEGAELVEEAWTIGAYTLHEAAGYPALRKGGSASVRGELYLVPEPLLAVLDAFEGAPLLFARRPVRLASSGGVAAEAYFWAAAGAPSAVIPSGDWRAFRARGRGTP
jgi:gamma-glutamylcyclotransferase (GGCT)/AIG2-like uncharacterized protein YtfP